MTEKKMGWPQQRFFEFRAGHGTYLAFAVSLVTFVLIVHRLLIERVPELDAIFAKKKKENNYLILPLILDGDDIDFTNYKKLDYGEMNYQNTKKDKNLKILIFGWVLI